MEATTLVRVAEVDQPDLLAVLDGLPWLRVRAVPDCVGAGCGVIADDDGEGAGECDDDTARAVSDDSLVKKGSAQEGVGLGDRFGKGCGRAMSA
jgi:hypothetical protein